MTAADRPPFDLTGVEDGDVVGLDGDLVAHYNKDDGSFYTAGLTLRDWLDGHSEAWAMTEEEARRVGVADYQAYVDRIRLLNPTLLGEAAPRP